VVGHEVDDQLEAARVGRGDERVGVFRPPEHRVDRAVVGDVVAGVGLRRWVERGDPQRVDPEGDEVVEAAHDAQQVADAVAVGVGERARIDLVDDGVAPPGRGVRGGVGRGLGAHLRVQRFLPA
jgi:hypothetical protein